MKLPPYVFLEPHSFMCQNILQESTKRLQTLGEA